MTKNELISRNRKIILKTLDDKCPKFFYDFADNSKILQRILCLPNLDPIELNPKSFKKLEIFVECLSNNKILKKDTVFLYQAFPSSIMVYHNFLIKACLEKDTFAIHRLIEFFQSQNFINLREPVNLNSALHFVSSNGYFSILLYLLENHADVNIKNKDGNSPIFLAINAFHRDCAKLLLEFGADVTLKNTRNNTIMTQPLGNEFKLFLDATMQRLSDIIPGTIKGDLKTLETILNEHISGLFPLCTLRSRFINGSTLLHTCAYYNYYQLVKKLLNTEDFDGKPLNVDTRDYKGATALFRARDCELIKLLVDFGADVNAIDLDGNTPLHAKFYGEKNQPSDLDAIKLLIYYKANILAKNNKKLLPIHMAAMQGRIDVISYSIDIDTQQSIHFTVYKNPEIIHTPSFLAIINDQQACAEWLLDNGFTFKENEIDIVLYKILTGEITVKNILQILLFLINHGCNLNTTFSGGNKALHLAASLNSSQTPDIIKVLIENGAHVDALNDDAKTPLFMSIQAGNPLAAATLLNFNADYQIISNDGTTAFDLIKDIDEWVKLDLFDTKIRSILESYENKQTRDLIRTISQKINKDFSSTGFLLERDRTIDNYINQHNKSIHNFNKATSSRSQSAKTFIKK